MKELLYGAAYYDEYMPYERLAKDVSMMQKAGINTVRIAESTWSTCEPQRHLWDKTEHGHYTSGLPLSCRKSNP